MNTLLKGLVALVAGIFGFGLMAAGMNAAAFSDDDVKGSRDGQSQGVVLVADRDDDNDNDDNNDRYSRHDSRHDSRGDRNDVSRNDNSRDLTNDLSRNSTH